MRTRKGTSPGPLVLRSPAARIGAWVWLAFAALNFADLAWRGRDLASLVAAAVLLTGCGLAYVFGLRPRVVAAPEALELHNPFRTVRIPWPAVRKIEATNALVIRYSGPGDTEHTARAWVLQTSPRAQAREQRQIRKQAENLPPNVAQHVVKRTSLSHAVEQLTTTAATHATTPTTTEPTTTWSLPALAAIAVPTALLAITITAAVAT
ncbi:MAG TPA: PH domain-containing protein [Thermomonospora sp.]|nr:PH domain-containing protein [Thermomonospora sp.]